VFPFFPRLHATDSLTGEDGRPDPAGRRGHGLTDPCLRGLPLLVALRPGGGAQAGGPGGVAARGALYFQPAGWEWAAPPGFLDNTIGAQKGPQTDYAAGPARASVPARSLRRAVVQCASTTRRLPGRTSGKRKFWVTDNPVPM